MFFIPTQLSATSNAVLCACAARANTIVSATSQDGVNLFIAHILVPITRMVMEAKKVKAVVTDEAIKGHLVTRLAELEGIKVHVGGLGIGSTDYAQANLTNSSIHVNAEWMARAVNDSQLTEEGSFSLTSIMHMTVLTAKLLHEFIHLLTGSIMIFVYGFSGKPVTSRHSMDIPVSIGRKSVASKKGLKEQGDLSLAAEELIFGNRLYLSFPKADPFAPRDVVFSSEQRDGWRFTRLAEFTAWAHIFNTANLRIMFRPVQEQLENVSTKPSTQKGGKRTASIQATSSIKRQKSAATDYGEDSGEISGSRESEELEVMYGAGEDSRSFEDGDGDEEDDTYGWRRLYDEAPPGRKN